MCIVIWKITFGLQRLHDIDCAAFLSDEKKMD